VADALPKESFSEAATTLTALTDAKKFSKNLADDAVKAEAARAVNARFGGRRHRDRNSDTKVLTQEGFDEMMVRLELQNSKQNTRSMGAVVDEKVVQAAAADPLFSAMYNMTNLKKMPEVVQTPETALPEAGTVEPHRGQRGRSGRKA